MRKFEKISKKQLKKDFVNIQDPFIKLPERATAKSAGYDFFSPIDIKLKPGAEILIPTGIKVSMETDEVLQIFPRSSHGFKYFIRLANTIGIIDSDYYNNKENEGHIWIKIRNEGNTLFYIKSGTRMAQSIFIKYLITDNDTLTGKIRQGGIGSTN